MAIPYFGTGNLVVRAVESVLVGRVRDVRVVVVGDGQVPPLTNEDSRLEVYLLPENRGAWFAHQLILQASPDPWYAPVDSDDWVEQDHLSQLVAIAETGATAIAAGSTLEHSGPFDRRGHVKRRRQLVGMFARSRLLELGGFAPHERLSQDALLLYLLDHNGGVALAPRPTYHWVRRPGSLTRSPETSHRSPARTAARDRWQAVLEESDRLANIDAIRRYRDSLVPPAVAAGLAEHVAILSQRLER